MDKTVTVENAYYSEGTERADILHNFDMLLGLMETATEVGERYKNLNHRVQELKKQSVVKELKKPVKNQSIVNTVIHGKDANDQKDFLDIAKLFGGLIGVFYVVSKICLSIPANFLFIVGGIIHLIGLGFGLIAYWPLRIPAKILDILTPFEIQGFYDTLYGPISGYIKFALGGIVMLGIVLLVYRTFEAHKEKKAYKKELKEYKKNEKKFPQQEEKRVAKVNAELETLQPQLEAAKKELEKYEKAVHGVKQLMGIDKEDVQRLRRCVENMRADTVEEAIKEYERDCKHGSEMYKIREAFEEKKKKLKLAYAMKGIALEETELECQLEAARYEEQESARKAHNAAVIEDYNWHQMAGDIGDMETYAFMKLMDLEF